MRRGLERFGPDETYAVCRCGHLVPRWYVFCIDCGRTVKLQTAAKESK